MQELKLKTMKCQRTRFDLYEQNSGGAFRSSYLFGSHFDSKMNQKLASTSTVRTEVCMNKLTRLLQVGVTYPPPHLPPQTRFSHHCTKTAWNFLERFRGFS